MFDQFQNSVKISMTLVPDGPLLLRGQNTGLDPAIADMEFMRTTRNGQSTVYLPGSSVKGVVRAHTERLLRGHNHFACDPTRAWDEQTCGNGKYARDHRGPHYPHGGQCSACFTWGSLQMAGRFRFGDAYPPADLAGITNHTEVRTGVGIERRFQSAQRGVLYDNEVVTGGGFELILSGENFDLWQLGLAAQALRDLNDGLYQLGGCKSRGMGTVRLEHMRVEFRFLAGSPAGLAGAASSKYKLAGAHLEVENQKGFRHEQKGLFRETCCEGEAVDWLFDRLIEDALRTYLDA